MIGPMIEGIKTLVADWWQAILAWDPHWVVQVMVGAVLVWVLTHTVRWSGKMITESAKRSYAAILAEKDKHQARVKKDSRWWEIKFRAMKHGELIVLVEFINAIFGSLFSVVIGATAFIVVVLGPDDTATIWKILGWAVVVAAIIGFGNNSRITLAVLEAIDRIDDEELDAMVEDEDGRKIIEYATSDDTDAPA